MNQKELIEQIIEAESRAQSISDEALLKKEKMDEDLAKETEAMRSEFLKRAKSRIDQISKIETAETAETINRQNAHYQEKLQEIETTCASKKEEWIDTIFNLVIGK